MICVGESHTAAIAKAAKTLKEDVIIVNLSRFVDPLVSVRGKYRLDRPIRKLLNPAAGPLFSVVGGNTHNLMGLARHPRPFDFILPEEPDLPLDRSAEVVPYSAIRAIIERRAQPVFNRLQALVNSYDGNIFHLQSPPPARKAKVVETTNKLTAEIEKYGVAPAMLRYRLWRAHSTVIRSFCDKLSVRFVAVPPESMDERGLLLPRLTANATHGNEHYGAMVLAQMKSAST